LFGLIGPDGAGKTTLFRTLATLLLPDKGEATIDGQNVVTNYKAIRHTIGYMPGRFSLYPDLTVLENLEFYAAVFGTTIEANYEQIKPIYSQIEPFKNRRAAQLSGGMKQKLALSCALVHKPSILLLDEPTTGVDPVSRKEFWDILKSLKAQQLTILVATPYMDEAALCDRIALMQKGKILDQDTPKHMVQKNAMPLLQVRGAAMFDLLKTIRTWEKTISCFAFGDSHHVSVDASVDVSIGELQQFLLQKGIQNVEIEAIEPNIEDIFMKLLNQDKK
jgi:ABC-type multidrug transport system ATPase subunit